MFEILPVFAIARLGLFLETTSNSDARLSDVAQPVPLHLRNAPTSLMKNIGYGQGYQYAHDLEGKVADMQCLPDNLKDREYYAPTNEGVERRIRERLEEIKRMRRG